MPLEDIRATRPSNNAILWVVTGTSPRLLAGLFYSIASVIWTGGLSSVDRERFAYVVAHDSLACADVTARFLERNGLRLGRGRRRGLVVSDGHAHSP